MNLPEIKDPLTCSLQVYWTDKWQLGNLLEAVLEYTGPARVIITTFSTSEEFLRKMHKLKKQGKVTSAVLFCDHKAAEKTSTMMPLMRNVYQDIVMMKNHSKVMIVEAESKKVVILTSQNNTRGNRHEDYTIVSLDDIVENILQELNKYCEENGRPGIIQTDGNS